MFELCDQYSFERFKTKIQDLNYIEKGIFFSEMFFFLEECKRLNINTVAESGVRQGMSTRVLMLASNYKIFSVDKDLRRSPVWQGSKRHRYIKGDSMVCLLELINDFYWRDFAILIDGPKRELAIELKNILLARYNVRLVAIHDLMIDDPLAADADNHSQCGAFRDDGPGAELDDMITPKYRLKYPNGPGLAIWENKRNHEQCYL